MDSPDYALMDHVYSDGGSIEDFEQWQEKTSRSVSLGLSKFRFRVTPPHILNEQICFNIEIQVKSSYEHEGKFSHYEVLFLDNKENYFHLLWREEGSWRHKSISGPVGSEIMQIGSGQACSSAPLLLTESFQIAIRPRGELDNFLRQSAQLRWSYEDYDFSPDHRLYQENKSSRVRYRYRGY